MVVSKMQCLGPMLSFITRYLLVVVVAVVCSKPITELEPAAFSSNFESVYKKESPVLVQFDHWSAAFTERWSLESFAKQNPSLRVHVARDSKVLRA